MELILKNINKSYGSKQVLKNLSACFGIGINAVLGPNGSGKSTLISIICGNLMPESGEILWNGVSIVKKKSVFNNSLGYVPQTIAEYPDFSEDEYLFYLAALKGIPTGIRKSEVERVLRAVDLHKEHALKIRTLSEGMKRRLLIAQSLLGDPKVLIMDEPTAGLDPGQRIAFKQMLEEISTEKVVIIATHIVPDIENLAGNIMFLKNGHLDVVKNEFSSANHQLMTPLERAYYSYYK